MRGILLVLLAICSIFYSCIEKENLKDNIEGDWYYFDSRSVYFELYFRNGYIKSAVGDFVNSSTAYYRIEDNSKVLFCNYDINSESIAPIMNCELFFIVEKVDENEMQIWMSPGESIKLKRLDINYDPFLFDKNSEFIYKDMILKRCEENRKRNNILNDACDFKRFENDFEDYD